MNEYEMQEEELEEHKRNRRFRRALTVFIIVFSCVALLGQYNNRQRIHDIQKSRVLSCQRNYQTTRDIFRPFFPPKKHRTVKQQENINKFLHLTDPRKCIKQVATK